MDPSRNDISTPYHTKFFDMILVPPPQTAVENSLKLNDCKSTMLYKDAILNAIEDLKDSHNGSTVTAIKKHAKAHLFPDQDQETEKMSPTFSSTTSPPWKDNIFVQAVKSLVSEKAITHSECIKNGSALYKLSPSYKKRRAKQLKERFLRFEKCKARQQKKRKELSLRKEAPIGKPALKKGHLVEAKTVTIVDKYNKSKMDLELDRPREKRSALPRQQLELHADHSTRGRKSLRQKLKIPHTRLIVKDV